MNGVDLTLAEVASFGGESTVRFPEPAVEKVPRAPTRREAPPGRGAGRVLPPRERGRNGSRQRYGPPSGGGKRPASARTVGVPHLFEDGFPCGALYPPAAQAPGRVDFDDRTRRIPVPAPLAPDPDEVFRLAPGAYWIRYAETVNLPADVFAIGRTRSSLLRSGAQLGTALWDSGYSGRSGSLLTVHHELGLELARCAPRPAAGLLPDRRAPPSAPTPAGSRANRTAVEPPAPPP